MIETWGFSEDLKPVGLYREDDDKNDDDDKENFSALGLDKGMWTSSP